MHIYICVRIHIHMKYNCVYILNSVSRFLSCHILTDSQAHNVLTLGTYTFAHTTSHTHRNLVDILRKGGPPPSSWHVSHELYTVASIVTSDRTHRPPPPPIHTNTQRLDPMCVKRRRRRRRRERCRKRGRGSMWSRSKGAHDRRGGVDARAAGSAFDICMRRYVCCIYSVSSIRSVLVREDF